MKKCTYCAAENRDEAIFCTRCKRPLQAGQSQSSKDRAPGNVIAWLLGLFIVIGLSLFLFSSRPFLAPTATPVSTSDASHEPAAPVPTRTREPITPGACIKHNTVRIRRGPGTQYETTGGLSPGMCLTIIGRNQEASWVYIVSDDSQTGWVDASLLSDAGDLDRVSIRDHSTMTNAARPTLTTAELAHGAQLHLTKIAATNLPHAPLTRYMVPCFTTADRIGDHISCRLERAYCDYLPTVEGSPTVCNDRPSPDQTFALVIPGRDGSEYDGQCLIVEGFLKIARGTLQIEALDRSQVSPCE